MNQKKIPGLLVSIIELVASIVFLFFLYSTKMFPMKILLLVGVGLVLVTVIVFLLTMNIKHKVRFGIGVFLIVLTCALYMIGGSYLKKGVNTLANISSATIEKTGIGIYVRANDKAEKLKDTKGYRFGVLEALDRDNTEAVVAKIKKVNGEVETKHFKDVSVLVDGLLKSESINAIVLNNGFLSMLEDQDDYEAIMSQLRLIHTEEVVKEVKPEEAVVDASIPKIFSVYISGIDSREGLVANSRSDVNIVATVNTETHQVLLVSTPRDYFVPLSISNGVPDKLTHAGIYGVDVSMDTLEMLYKTNIDYYFRINFGGFEQIIDALGGITIYSDYTFDANQTKGGYSFVQGENHVNGAQALSFARERYAFTEGDRQRGKNQLHVIEGVINKATSPALLKNYTKIMESLAGSFETNIPYDMIASLVRQQLSDGGSWKVESYSVDGTGSTEVPYSMSVGAYVMLPNYETVKTAVMKMNQVKDGIVMPQ